MPNQRTIDLVGPVFTIRLTRLQMQILHEHLESSNRSCEDANEPIGAEESHLELILGSFLRRATECQSTPS
jgi:hypothetical protein